MASLPALGIVSVNGVGIDKVDLPFARSRGVRVGNTPGAPTIDTADLAVGLVISLLRGLPAADAYVRAGRWPQGDLPLTRRVTGCAFGIVGLGSIGSAVAARLAPFGPIAYTGPNRKPVDYAYQPDLLVLARQSDVLVYGLSMAHAITEGLEVVGEVHGQAQWAWEFPRPGAASRATFRGGIRYTHGGGRIDAGLLVGTTREDPGLGLTVGYTHVFDAFTPP